MVTSSVSLRRVLSLLLPAWLSLAGAVCARSVEAPPLVAGAFPVACSDVAYDVTRMNEIGGAPADFWEGNPQNGRPRYFTDILLEPNDTLQIGPLVPNNSSYYPQTANRPLPLVLLVCYPTGPGNSRADYPLPGGLVVPKMQRAGQKPIFPPLILRPILPGESDPNLLPLIVLSHGLSGSPLDIEWLDVIGRLASFGYLVAAPFHGDARFTLLKIGDLSDLFSFIDNFDHFVEMEGLRPLGLKATVDALLAHPDFGPRIDPDKIGGFGASMGGASMLWLLGASVTDGLVSHNAHPTVHDPRLKAAVGYVPFAGESFLPAFGESNATAAAVNTPFLALSGTADNVAPIARAAQAVGQLRSSRYLVALTGVPHAYDGTYAGDVIGWTVPFLNAYVRGDASAMAAFLQQKDVAGGLDDNLLIDYTAPNAGAFGTTATGLWWNPQESGWGIGFDQQGDVVFATLFTYDLTGQPLWLVMSNGVRQADGSTFAGDLYQTTGPPFNASPFTPIGAANVRKVGTLSVTFTSLSQASLSYSVDGTTVRKAIQQQVFGSRPALCRSTQTTRTALSNYQGLWWNPRESGWGIGIAHQDDTLFATLFNYDANGRGIWFVMSAGVKQADGSYLGDLYQTTGPAFSAQPFTPIVAANMSKVGSMQLRFSDGVNGTLNYSVGGLPVTKAITRQDFSTPATACIN